MGLFFVTFHSSIFQHIIPRGNNKNRAYIRLAVPIVPFKYCCHDFGSIPVRTDWLLNVTWLCCSQCQYQITSDLGTVTVRPAPVTQRPAVTFWTAARRHVLHLVCAHWPKQCSGDWTQSQLLSSF